MSDIKKDHSIGEGTGAVAGTVAGAAVGSMAGPVGTVVGAIAGGALGAKGGGAVAEALNPTEYNNYFEKNYTSAPYYVGGSEWRDYKPAYQYGYDTYGQYRGQRFEHYRSREYIVHDYRRYGWRPPPRGYAYYRTDSGDVVLAAIATGIIASIIANDR